MNKLSKFKPIKVQFYIIKCCLIILFSLLSNVNTFRFSCPQNSIIRPCTCQEKSKGFDFNCEGMFVNWKKSNNPLNFDMVKLFIIWSRLEKKLFNSKSGNRTFLNF